MAQRSSPRGEPSGVPVVLCCALGEEAEVEDAADALRERGIAVEVLVGVELDPRALAAAIDRWRGEGLYVLCRAGALDRVRVDALREVLLARRVPFGRTLTVGATTKAELLERVEQGLKKIVPIARPAASPPAPAPAGPSESSGTVRPRRQTIPVIPASVTRTLQGGPRPAPPGETTRSTSAPPPPPRPSPPAIPGRKLAATVPTPSAAKAASARASETVAEAAPAPETVAGEAPTVDTIAGEAPTPETAAGEAPSPETIVGEAPTTETMSGAQSRHDTIAGVPPGPAPAPVSTEPTTDADDITFAGPTEVRLPVATAEPTQTKQPDTSITAMEVDAEPLEDEDVTRTLPKRDEDELAGLDLDGMLAGIGDGPDLAARGNTVVAREPSPTRGDTVLARVTTLRAPALPQEAYPDDAPEISLSDGEVIVDRTMVTPKPPPLPTPLTTTMPTPQATAPVVVEEASGGAGKLLVAAIVGALGLGVLVAVIVSGRDDAETTARADAPSGTSVVADASKRDAQPDDAKPVEAKPQAATPDAPEAADAKQDAPEDDGGKPDATAIADATPTEAIRDAKAPKPALAGATVKSAPKLPTLARPPVVPPPPKTRVQAALRAREIRALDILLVARKATRPLPYAEAERHCAGLDIRGIQGWRLPDVGELSSLGDAGFAGRGYYWSSTAGDTFGDTHMAWNGRNRQSGSRLKPAAALCVRGDVGEAQ
jgi:hypothetical protein